jgi:hypothetical protein
MPRNFLFVNKDPSSSSLTRSSDTEQSNINSYVQRGRRHVRSAHAAGRRRPTANIKEKDKSLVEPESSASASSPSNSSTSSSSTVAIRSPPTGFSSFAVNQANPSQSPPDRALHRTLTSSTGSLDDAAVTRIRNAQQTADDLISIATPHAGDDYESQQETLTTPPTSIDESPHDITQVSLSSIDPFQNSAVRLDAQTVQLLQYYRDRYHPAVWHAETRATPRGNYAFQTSAKEVIQSALASDVDMYALLACMASRLEYIDRQPGQNVDEYLGKALAATRRVLKERAKHGPKSHEEILMIIFHLYATEGYRNNVSEARIHMRGAKTIVQLLGGLSKLRDPQMRELLVTGDGLLSAMTLQPCELPCEFDPGSYLAATSSELRFDSDYDLINIATALHNRPDTSFIPESFNQLIEETAEINWVLQQAKDGTPLASTHAMRWLQIRNMAVRHHLLAVVTQDSRLDIFRATLVLWIVTTTTMLGQQRLGARMAPQIRAKLERGGHSGQAWGVDTNIKAWVLSLCAMCAISGSLDETWFINELEMVISSSGTGNRNVSEEMILGNLVGLQQQFFYHEAVYGPRAQHLATKMSSNRSSQPG